MRFQKLIISITGLSFLFTGCALFSPDAYEAQERHARKLNPLIGKADTLFIQNVYGWPMEKLGRTWSYKYEKVNNNRESSNYVDSDYKQKEIEILYIVFDERGILKSWDLLTYYRSWLSKLF